MTEHCNARSPDGRVCMWAKHSDDDHSWNRKGPNFEGYPDRECGEHRTVGPHRAWCFDCSEWCYSRTVEMACKGCELPALRAQVASLTAEVLDYRNAITWDTTCFNCAKLLDSSYAETVRAEKTEAKLDRARKAVRQMIDGMGSYDDYKPVPAEAVMDLGLLLEHDDE